VHAEVGHAGSLKNLSPRGKIIAAESAPSVRSSPGSRDTNGPPATVGLLACERRSLERRQLRVARIAAAIRPVIESRTQVATFIQENGSSRSVSPRARALRPKACVVSNAARRVTIALQEYFEKRWERGIC
jgi:hypothetical protein